MSFLEKEIKKILIDFNGRNVLEEILPKTEFYSMDTYGKFESSIYKEMSPKEYFSSEEWTEKFKSIVSECDVSNGFKQDVRDRISEVLDSELKFFGDADIIENFKNNNQSLVIGMFTELNRKLLAKINDTYDIDDFDEALDNVLYNEFSAHNTLGIENLYPKKITLYYNTSNFNTIDETFFYAEDGLLRLTSENIELLNKIVNHDEVREVLSLNNRNYEDDIKEQISEGFESYAELDGTDKKEGITFAAIFKAVSESQHGFYPVFRVETNYEELSSLRSKKVQGRDLENASLILIESTTINPKIINLGKLNSLKINIDHLNEESDFISKYDKKYIESQLKTQVVETKNKLSI